MSLAVEGNAHGNARVNVDEFPDAETTQMQAACFYALQLGLPILPTDPESKGSLIKAWERCASTDRSKIHKWWKQWPDAGIGLLCGPRSGIAVLDIDVKEKDDNGLTGMDHLRLLIDKHGPLGEANVATPSGGHHYYFRWDSLPFAKSEGRVAFGIDFRSARSDESGAGYVVMPPSPRSNGCYEWGAKLFTSVGALPVAPEWLAIFTAFDADERKVIAADRCLRELIIGSDRREWRGVFERHAAAEKKRDDIYRKAVRTLVGSKCEAPSSVDHPYVAAALTGILHVIRNAKHPQNSTLFEQCASAGNYFATLGLDIDSPEVEKFTEDALTAACEMKDLDPAYSWKSAKGRKSAASTIRSGLTTGLTTPKDLSHVGARASGGGSHDNGAEPDAGKSKAATRTANIVSMSEVRARPIDWAWEGRIAKGACNLLVGQPGQGKSQITCDIAARITRGTPYPDEDKASLKRKPQRVVMLNAEDALDCVVKPRLLAAGADLLLVDAVPSVLKVEKDGSAVEVGVSLREDIATLDALLESLGDVALVVIDPISAFLDKIDSHNNSEVRSILAPIARLAEKHNVAVLLVTHLNKGADPNALNRITGSGAFGAAARSVLTIGPNLDDDGSPVEGERVLLSMKSNLGKPPEALVYRIKGETVTDGGLIIPTSRIVWTEARSDLSAAQVLNAEGDAKKVSALDRAVAWLRERLGSSCSVSSVEIMEAGRAHGHAERTLQRAREVVGARLAKDGKGGWKWVYTAPGAASC